MSQSTQGSYRNGKTEFKDFSRTIQGLFSFFKDSISSQFCNIKQRGKCTLFSRKRQSGNRKKQKSTFFFFDSDSSDKNRNYCTIE